MTANVVVHALVFGLFAGLAAAALERLAVLLSRTSRHTRRAATSSPPSPRPSLSRLPWALAIVATAASPLLEMGNPAPRESAESARQAATAIIASEASTGSLWSEAVVLVRSIPASAWELANTTLHLVSNAAADAIRPIENLIPLLWLLASISLLVFGLVVWANLYRQRQYWHERTIDGTPVLISPDCGPAVLGIWTGRIVIPAWLLELAEPLRAMVLKHEREHLRARDPGLLFIAALALVIQPWNPALWWQLRRLRLAIEMDCDARVLNDGADMERYGLLLLAVGQRTSRTLATVAALAENRTSIARRIANMTASNEAPSRRRVILWAAMATAAIAVACNVPDISQTEVESGEASASVSGAEAGAPYFEFQVAKAAERIPGSPAPQYPAELRSAGIAGRVIVQFIVDTDGLVEPGSMTVIESDHAAFTEAVRTALSQMRFSPAELEDGRVVRQNVQQPFIFAIQ